MWMEKGSEDEDQRKKGGLEREDQGSPTQQGPSLGARTSPCCLLWPSRKEAA